MSSHCAFGGMQTVKGGQCHFHIRHTMHLTVSLDELFWVNAPAVLSSTAVCYVCQGQQVRLHRMVAQRRAALWQAGEDP